MAEKMSKMKERNTNEKTPERSSTKNTLLVRVCTLFSRILGFVRIAVIGSIFGRYRYGRCSQLRFFTIPNNLRKLMAEGALSSAFIPSLSHAVMQDETGARPKKVVHNLITFQVLVLVPLCILCIIFARPLIESVLVNFDSVEQTELGIRLFRWFINYLLLISISAAMMGTLQVHNNFAVPAITPILFSICVISSILLLHKVIGVFSMVLGVLSGGVLQILFQYPAYRRFGYSLKPDFRFRNEDFRKIMKNWLPVVATASIFTINEQVAIRFATALDTGSTSALHYALVFFQLPFGIFSASITTVLFPRMSKQSGSNDREGLAGSLQYGVRFLAITLIPSAAIMSILGREIISVAMFRGNFTAEATAMTAAILQAYCIGLFSVGGFTFLQRFNYSIHNYRVPFIFALGVAAADIVPFPVAEGDCTPCRRSGSGEHDSFHGRLHCSAFFRQTRAWYNTRKKIILTLLKTVISTIPAIVFLYVFKHFTPEWWMEGSSMKGLLMLIIEGIVAVALVLGLFFLLKVEIFTDYLVKRKIGS